ncbi:MAG: acyltransferase [Solirubrobacterales bacterium]|nr:acyltransferase [Solirubrobacterales bacterium]
MRGLGESRFGWTLGLLFGVALLARLVLIAITDGSTPDINAFVGVNDALRSDPLHVYSLVNDAPRFAWPYPSLYLPVVGALFEASTTLGIAFGRLVRLPEVGADLAIAWLVQWHLAFRGASPRTRVTAAALILLSPAMMAVSGMHGQVDPVQWLPAIVGLIAWERLPAGQRAPVAGLLIGVGAATKTMPALVALALLPHGESWRERSVLLGACAAVPLAAMVPFLLADPGGVGEFLSYSSIPGQGGLSMIVQPDLALLRFAGQPVEGFSGAQDVLQDVAPVAVLLTTIALTILLMRRRPDPAAGSAILIIGVFVMGANFFAAYLTWLVPFLVLAGWRRFYWVITALVVIPLAVRYAPPSVPGALGMGEGFLWDEWVIGAMYIPAMGALWAAFAWRLATWVRRGSAPWAAPDPVPPLRPAWILRPAPGLEPEPHGGGMPGRSHLLGVLGLRGVAAGCLVVWHTYLWASSTGPPDLGWLSRWVAPHVQLGLWIFFCLSAFLLYRPFVAALLEGRERPSFGAYLRNRALRILPAYWAILLVVTFVLQTAIVRVPEPHFGIHLPTLAADLLLLHSYHPSGVLSGIGPTWSLCAEAVFYLGLPALVLLAGRLVAGASRPRWRVAACLVPGLLLIVVGVAFREVGQQLLATPDDPTGFQGSWFAVLERSFLAQADLFGFGMLLAVLQVLHDNGRLRLSRHWRPAAATSTALVAVAVVYALETGRLEYQYYATFMGFASMVLVAVVVLVPRARLQRDVLVRLLESPPFRYAGLVSYSVFLWHYPVVFWLRLHGWTVDGRLGFALNLLIVASITGVLSAITYRWVEVSFLRRRATGDRGDSAMRRDALAAGAAAAP